MAKSEVRVVGILIFFQAQNFVKNWYAACTVINQGIKYLYFIR